MRIPSPPSTKPLPTLHLEMAPPPARISLVSPESMRISLAHAAFVICYPRELQTSAATPPAFALRIDFIIFFFLPTHSACFSPIFCTLSLAVSLVLQRPPMPRTSGRRSPCSYAWVLRPLQKDEDLHGLTMDAPIVATHTLFLPYPCFPFLTAVL